jgi:5-methylcytosine-specific restriction endonuclease McrA
MDSPFYPEVSEEEIQRERQKARALRKTPWWNRKRGKVICFYCQNKFKTTELTMDHKVPIIRGGKSVKGNLVPCCKPCNDKKKHKLAFEWEEYT